MFESAEKERDICPLAFPFALRSTEGLFVIELIIHSQKPPTLWFADKVFRYTRCKHSPPPPTQQLVHSPSCPPLRSSYPSCTLGSHNLGQATKARERYNMADTRGRGSSPTRAIRNRSRERDRVKERETNDQKVTIDREKVRF